MTNHTLDTLFATIQSRKGTDPASSYTAKLLDKGRGKICEKIGEEATEVIVAALSETPDNIASESADLLYHLAVLWAEAGIKPEDVWEKLEAREGTSGIDEKASRPKE